MVDAVLPLPITIAATASVVLGAAEEPDPDADPDVVLDADPEADCDGEPLAVVLDSEGEAELPALVADAVGVEDGPSVVDGDEVGVLEGEALVGVED